MEALAIALPVASDLDGLAETLTLAGARVTRYASEPEQSSGPLEAWLAGLIDGHYDDVLFSSGQAVRLIVELARQLDREDAVIEALRRVRKLAAGARARGVLQEYGLSADILAESKSAESLAVSLQGTNLAGRVVAIAQLGPDHAVIELLEAKGATACAIDSLAATAVSTQPRLGEILLGSELDLVIFDKGSELSSAWRLAEGRRQLTELRQALERARVVALSDAAAEAVRRRGVHVDTVFDPFSTDTASRAELGRALGLVSEPPPPSPLRVVRDNRSTPHTVVVIGNGMVGHRFCERLREYDTEGRYRGVVFCEEPHTAYDRVRLTSYFETQDPALLQLADQAWYKRAGVRVLLGERATKLDRKRRAVLSSSGEWVQYDYAVLATGSVPWVPPVPGMNKAGVFVYRTIEDLERIAAYAGGKTRAMVLGGGLLGLEAAKALLDLGLETHVVETAPRLMPRQLDTAGARLLEKLVRSLGVHIHLSRSIVAVQGERHVEGIDLHDGEHIEADMIVACAGIRPRDELARDARLKIGDRGGIVVDDELRTSDDRVFAIGECALHRNVCYGLVGPGYEMADVLAKNLSGQTARYSGSDQSAKLKLLGVDVASFGDPFLEPPQARSIVYEDLVKGVYKKLVLSEDGKRLEGGVLVGDATEYPELCTVFRGAQELPAQPEQLILGRRGGGGEITLSDSAQICSCNGVSKGEIVTAVRDGGCGSVAEVKKCTKAGSGCGGCVPLVTDILNAELRAAGKATQNYLCEHFKYSRRELYEIVKINRERKFEQLLASHGAGSGCEVCKPAVASILASVFNEPILNHETLQDTNDRFLANLQRTGLYSVVPRIPGGEITPEKLIKLGEVAKKYGLYTKITGGQRIDLFGASVSQLPEIWAELVAAGFESGHAYGKAMRTVKSCVGSTWCRFGVQDSVAFAIRIENRYKGVRAPHKLKSAVSGCIRECAEAQSKDFGVIATERGWNVYVCGNGGAKPRHADLLAQDLDEDTVIKYLDRFLMYYIRTADKLTRTSTWVEKMEGGIEYLKQVILHDRLGICAQLEKEMQYLVDTYTCEWAEVVNDPARRARFQHFANSSDPDDSVDLVSERGQHHPADWPLRPVTEAGKRRLPVMMTGWVKVALAADVPKEGGIAIKYGRSQIAVFNFASRGQWYACQNMCPHTGDMVLARGIVGDQAGQPKVACPMHKKTFSLETGECLSGDPYAVLTFPVRVEDGSVWLELPAAAELEAEIGREAKARACAFEACTARAGAA